MKKEYILPELEVVRYRLIDVILTSPTDTVPIQDGGDEPDPNDPELPELPDL